MHPRLIFAVLLFALAAPAAAGVMSCTSQMTTAGLCRDDANRLLFFDMTVSDMIKVRDGICTSYNYQATIDGAPNPESCGEFAQRRIKKFLVDMYRNGVAKQAAQDALEDAQNDPTNTVDVGDDGSG